MIKRHFTAIFLFALLAISGLGQDPDIELAAPPTPPPAPAKSTVHGRVFYADTGRAVRRASIMLLSEDGGGPGESGSVTDSEGFFQVKGVKAGTYYAMINAPGIVSPMAFADFSKSSDKDIFSQAFMQFEKIVVNGLTDVDVQIPARRGGAIGGRVTYDDGDPAIGLRVEILRRSGDEFWPIVSNLGAMLSMFGGGGAYQTDDRGVYRFPGLPPGDYKVKVTENISHNDGPSKTRDDPFISVLTGGSAIFSIYYPDVMDGDNAQIVSIGAGAEQTEINVVIPNHKLYRIRGKIIAGPNKAPVKGAVVTLKRKGESNLSIFNQMKGGQLTASTDELGAWDFKELPKGEYQVTVERTGGGYTEDMDGEAYAADGANAVTNSPSIMRVNARPAGPPPPRYAKKIQDISIDDNDVSDIVVELGPGATMSGSVAVENSRETPHGVVVSAISKSGEAATRDGVAEAVEGERPVPGQAINTFRLENITVGMTILNIEVGEQKYYVKSAMLDGRDLLAAPFELKEGDNLRNIQITLGKDVGTLTGRVIDGEKEPVKNARITLVPTDAVKAKNATFYKSVTADSKGEFTVKVAAREYAIILDPARMAQTKKPDDFDKWLIESIKAAQKVTITENDTTTVKIILP